MQNDIRFGDIERPVPKHKEVLVRVALSGICGSDIPRVLGDASRQYPNILGHEFSGTIEEIGKDVTLVAVATGLQGSRLFRAMNAKIAGTATILSARTTAL